MKSLIIALVLASSFLFPPLSLAQEGGAPEKKQSSEIDQQQLNPDDPAVRGSYAIGVNTGMQLREVLSALKDTDFVMYDEAVIRGLVDGFKGNNAMNDNLFDNSMEWFNVNAEAAMKKKKAALDTKKAEEAAANLKASVDFLKQNKSKKGIVTLPSGLQYKILKAGSGISPTGNDRIKIHYAGRLADDTEFESSYKRLAPATLSLKSMIKGWEEALTLMKQGAKWTVFIPPELGYGEDEYDGIPANSVLIFDLELLDVIKAGDTLKK